MGKRRRGKEKREKEEGEQGEKKREERGIGLFFAKRGNGLAIFALFFWHFA
ncbi:MAG: hypothetical protein IIZ39_10175 [Blautia sp.]|nr:hypothetical protein [Blautia sp.]